MERRSLSYIVQATGGQLVRGSPQLEVQRVGTDSRQTLPGDLFVALAGDRFDGHHFIDAALDRGAVAVLIDAARDLPARACAVVGVRDPRRALGQLAARYRRDFALPVVGVAGSNGKTTTKELIASVLRRRYATLASEASFNNDIGVPLTLLQLDRTHQAAVFELGTNHPGELAPLIDLVRPNVGVITSIGREHLEFFGDLAGVAREEGVLGEMLPPEGVFYLPQETPWRAALIRRTRARVVPVGFEAGSEWRAVKVKVTASGTDFEVETGRTEFNGAYHLPVPGRHQALNGLLALAVGADMGLTREELRYGLADCHPPRMRMQVRQAGGMTILDDSYNANVDSMLAALATLAELPTRGRRIAVLGDMAELGPTTESAHAEIGEAAARHGVDVLFALGRWSARMGGAARAAGLERVERFEDVPAGARAVAECVQPGDTILVKASRSTGLERVVQQLCAASKGTES